MKNAFSLVELSIVLVILGLLVGGVLSGQSLIRAAELRTITSELHKYTGAVNTFKDKYFALPGDMNNATAFWGAANAVPATCRTTVSTDQRTCNGNGDGHVDEDNGASSYESGRFWQHMANAGLIEGQYNGQLVNYSPAEEPVSKLAGGIWYTTYIGQQVGGQLDVFPGFYGNNFQYSSLAAPWNILSPEEAWNVDKKLDDGLPGMGKVLAAKGDATTPCTSVAGTVTDTGAVYNLTKKGPQCSFFFLTAY